MKEIPTPLNTLLTGPVHASAMQVVRASSVNAWRASHSNWQAWQQGQAANLVQGPLIRTDLQTAPGFGGVAPPTSGGTGMPPGMQDGTQNPYAQTALSPMSPVEILFWV